MVDLEWFSTRVAETRKLVESLLATMEIGLNEKGLIGRVPGEPGIYAISVRGASPGEFLRAGETGNLNQRICMEHRSSSNDGNLPGQLVNGGWCEDLPSAREWIRTQCLVRYLPVEAPDQRVWAEHFMLATLRPKFLGRVPKALRPV